MGPNNNIPSLFQIMAWRRSGNKPLSETMVISWLTHICVTRPQWVKKSIGSLSNTVCLIKQIGGCWWPGASLISGHLWLSRRYRPVSAYHYCHRLTQGEKCMFWFCWNPLVKSGFLSQRARNAELWCFICCQTEYAVEYASELSVIWDAIYRNSKRLTHFGIMMPDGIIKLCCHIISDVLPHSSEDNFTQNTLDIYPWCEFENYQFKSVASPRSQWINLYPFPTIWEVHVSLRPNFRASIH